MSIDTQLRTQLTSAVDDTTVPPGLARAVLAGGRSRRRRRTAGGLALVTAVVVGAAMLMPTHDEPSTQMDAADGGRVGNAAALRWARTLPDGARPEVPFFAYGRLWSGDASVGLPTSVNVAVGPWAVADGWVVLVGKSEQDLAWAVLSPEGGLRELPPETWADGLGMVRIDVSPDGRQVATGKWLVDLTDMTASELPHAPTATESGGYVTEVRPKAFTAQGLVYEAAPYTQGLGTTWLLRPDGSTARVGLPPDTHIPDNSPGDVAVAYDYTADESDTCVTSYRLTDDQWAEEGMGCLGKGLGEALSISPGGHWLITDDLPRVWDLQAGEFATVGVPREVVAVSREALVGGIVWESDDSFLIPIADRTMEGDDPSVDFDQFVEVVRCRLSTGACERSATVENRVVLEPMSSTAFRFPTS